MNKEKQIQEYGNKQLIDEFIEYAETAFGVKVIVKESTESSYSFESLFGEMPKEAENERI